jgi:hypothetical protein
MSHRAIELKHEYNISIELNVQTGFKMCFWMFACAWRFHVSVVPFAAVHEQLTDDYLSYL